MRRLRASLSRPAALMLATQMMGLLAWVAVGVCCPETAPARPVETCPHANHHAGAACPLHAARTSHHDANTDECVLQCAHDNEIPSLLTTAGIVPAGAPVEPQRRLSMMLPARPTGFIDIASLPDSPPPRA